jgi:phosphatidylserine/phosphatidylglycerophosphate/cardiolipin synthase-like enzyme
MDQAFEFMSKAACRVAAELPFATAQIVARMIESSVDGRAARSQIATLPHPHHRSMATWLLDQWELAAPTLLPQAVALSLLTAAHAEQAHREEQAVELVWTGPDADAVPFRRTEQAILQVLDSACHRITLVSYAVYRIPHICDALVRAARRGVRINVIVETPDLIEGQGEYSTLRALGDDVASCAAVYYWPKDQRAKSDGGKSGILHVKCAAADGRWLFLSSANLTEYAFGINMELGVLLTGGKLPPQVEENFDRLIATSVLQRID